MLRSILFFLALVCLFGLPTAEAQVRSDEASSLDMKVLWTASVEHSLKSPDRETILLWQSSEPNRTVVDIRAAGELITIEPTAIGPDGKAIGIEGAKERASLAAKRFQYLGMKPVISERTIREIYLVIIADDGTVQLMDAETGETKWVTTVGRTNQPTLHASVNDRSVVLANGANVYVLDIKTGKTLYDIRAHKIPGTGGFASSERVFVPTVSGELLAYNQKNMREEPARFRCEGRLMVPAGVDRLTGVAAIPTSRNWTYFMAIEPPGPAPLFRLHTQGPVVVQPVPRDGTFILAAKNGELFRIKPEQKDGLILWSAATGDELLGEPVVSSDAVFAVTDAGILKGYSLENGQLLPGWENYVHGISAVLSATSTRVYAKTIANQIVAIDRQTARLAGAPIGNGIRGFYANSVNDRVYALTADGSIQCLSQIDIAEPVFHQKLELPKKKEDAKAKTPGEEKPAETSTEESADPFGASSESAEAAPAESTEDPFGAGSGDDPFGAEPKSE